MLEKTKSQEFAQIRATNGRVEEGPTFMLDVCMGQFWGLSDIPHKQLVLFAFSIHEKCDIKGGDGTIWAAVAFFGLLDQKEGEH